MKVWLLTLLLLLPVFSESISIDPAYVRMPVGSNQTFTIHAFGSGKLYDLKIYGAYLDWNQKRVWISPAGKTLSFTFSPRSDGVYTLGAQLENSSAEVTVEVYVPASVPEFCNSLPKQISSTKDPRAIKILNKALMYCNESKFSLARLELDELNDLGPLEKTSIIETPLPKIVLLGILAIVSIISIKLLFT